VSVSESGIPTEGTSHAPRFVFADTRLEVVALRADAGVTATPYSSPPPEGGIEPSSRCEGLGCAFCQEGSLRRTMQPTPKPVPAPAVPEKASSSSSSSDSSDDGSEDDGEEGGGDEGAQGDGSVREAKRRIKGESSTEVSGGNSRAVAAGAVGSFGSDAVGEAGGGGGGGGGRGGAAGVALFQSLDAMFCNDSGMSRGALRAAALQVQKCLSRSLRTFFHSTRREHSSGIRLER